MSDHDSSGYEAFGQWLKPSVFHGLRALGLDAVYQRASGDYLYTDANGSPEAKVLDLLGGYGVSLFGHNQPELVARAKRLFDRQVPFSAQASVRASAGLVAERLSSLVSQTTADEYIVTLSSTGTEAIECAIKHAELESVYRRDALREQLRRSYAEARLGLLHQQPERVAELTRQLDALERQALAALDRPPVFLAVEGSFHGKTSGSLSLTHYPSYREPWSRLTWETLFVPRGQPEAVAGLVEAACSELPLVELVDGALVIERRRVCDVVACFAEPVQGEGGVQELSAELLIALRRAADEHGYPLVFDEIQCGLGRCGSFLASAISGVHADYYVFGKALGGGLSKISATLICAPRYVPEFGRLHTSTFAEDELSSELALGALDILTRDGGRMIEACARKGQHLLAKLSALQLRFPSQLESVRGRGLMIGVELASTHESESALLRLLAEQDLLGYTACAYLLHNHRIRCAPTLSSPRTIRVEPSAEIPEAELDRFCDALEDLLLVLAERRTDHLVGSILTKPSAELGSDLGSGLAPGLASGLATGRAPAPVPSASRVRPHVVVSPDPHRVGFMVHFPEATDLRAWDRGLAGLDAGQCERFVAQTRGVLDPFALSRGQVVSRVGPRVEVLIVGVPFTTAQAMESMRAGDGWALDLVRRGVELARDEGCCVAGLGGHTSIVSKNCTAIDVPGIALTSGNSLAVYAAIEALQRIGDRCGLARTTAVGIVGAAGNIGSVVAEIMAESAERVVLIGHRGMHRFLEPVVDTLYSRALEQIRRGDPLAGVAAKIASATTTRRWLERSNPDAPNGFGEELRRELNGQTQTPVQVSTKLEVLRTCPRILTASNSARPLIDASHLGEGPVVICDIAVPRDVGPDVADHRTNVHIVRGGVLEAPAGSSLSLVGADLDPGELYACLAETILIALDDAPMNYSVGPLTRERVMHIGSVAQRHGFEIHEKSA